jgi:hypothetical protein
MYMLFSGYFSLADSDLDHTFGFIPSPEKNGATIIS